MRHAVTTIGSARGAARARSVKVLNRSKSGVGDHHDVRSGDGIQQCENTAWSWRQRVLKCVQSAGAVRVSTGDLGEEWVAQVGAEEPSFWVDDDRRSPVDPDGQVLQHGNAPPVRCHGG